MKGVAAKRPAASTRLDYELVIKIKAAIAEQAKSAQWLPAKPNACNQPANAKPMLLVLIEACSDLEGGGKQANTATYLGGFETWTINRIVKQGLYFVSMRRSHMVDEDNDFQTAGLLHVMEKLCSFDDFCALLSRGRMGFTPWQYSALKEMRTWSFDEDEQHDVQAKTTKGKKQQAHKKVRKTAR